MATDGRRVLRPAQYLTRHRQVLKKKKKKLLIGQSRIYWNGLIFFKKKTLQMHFCEAVFACRLDAVALGAGFFLVTIVWDYTIEVYTI